MNRSIVILAASAFVLAGFIPALSQILLAPKTEFEVASIKLNKSGSGVNGGCHGTDGKASPEDATIVIPLGRCRITAARLSHLITIAYRIQIQNLKGGPDWVWGFERFDIEGKAENPSNATQDQLLSMLQNLLASRFQLKFHRETKDVAGYALVVAKNGSKLKESGSEGRRSLRMTGAAIFKGDAIEGKNLDQNTILSQKVTMSQLAHELSYLPGASPVIDRTGLDGAYDFKLAWEPGESLSAVLQRQLGLKLESQKLPVETFVIDSAEKPSEN